MSLPAEHISVKAQARSLVVLFARPILLEWQQRAERLAYDRALAKETRDPKQLLEIAYQAVLDAGYQLHHLTPPPGQLPKPKEKKR